MKTKQHGFTLIELMIVVAIIGILAAIALPAYQDYTKRSYITEALSLAGAAKTAVSEYYASESVLPTNNEVAGLVTATSISGSAVTQVNVSGGLITVTFNVKVDSGTTMDLSPIPSTGSMKWECNNGNVPTRFLPSRCRS